MAARRSCQQAEQVIPSIGSCTHTLTSSSALLLGRCACRLSFGAAATLLLLPLPAACRFAAPSSAPGTAVVMYGSSSSVLRASADASAPLRFAGVGLLTGCNTGCSSYSSSSSTSPSSYLHAEGKCSPLEHAPFGWQIGKRAAHSILKICVPSTSLTLATVPLNFFLPNPCSKQGRNNKAGEEAVRPPSDGRWPIVRWRRAMSGLLSGSC